MKEFQHRVTEQKRVLAVVEAPRHFIEVGRHMLCRDSMPGAPSLRAFCARVGSRFRLLQNPLPVDHRDDQRLVLLKSVNDPITVDDKFAYVLIVKFRHFAARLRKMRQNPCLAHNVFENNAGVGGGIGSDVVGDGIEILGRVSTRLFGEPFAEATLHFLLRECAVDAGILQPATYLVENVEVVLDVFNRDVVRQSVQQRLNILFDIAHDDPFDEHTMLATCRVPQSMHQTRVYDAMPATKHVRRSVSLPRSHR